MRLIMGDVLQLENFFLTRLEIRLQAPLANEMDRDGEMELGYDVGRHKDQPNRYRLAFRIRMNPAYKKGNPDMPEVAAEIVGIFLFPENMPEDKREWLVRYNGGLMLYGLLRGQLATLSGAFPTGKIMLPSIDMKETILEFEKRGSKAAATQAGKQLEVKPKALKKGASTTTKKKTTKDKIANK